MQQDACDLAKAGVYLCGIGLVLGSLTFAGAAVVREMPDTPIFGWAAAALESPDKEGGTRLSNAIYNAQEIKAALARRIPRSEPLPPITAKLAYGHLRPGGSAALADHKIPKLTKLPKAALDAMAMDVSSNYRASSAVVPELHKVY